MQIFAKIRVMSDKTDKVITRFAPSPTGNLHIGGARTALFNYLFAKQNNGKFILRIDDTDIERSKPEYEEEIINGLKWLGLNWDEFCRQSDRQDIYKRYIKKLLEEDNIYISENEEGESKSVIRFRNPNKKISFEDLIRGRIEFDTTDLGDFVIAKNEETPLYHFSSVIDDFELKISHVIRGEDHISNTPRQILIQEAIGAPRPQYAHLPLILAPDRSKLSKRHGDVSLGDYQKKGYLAEAVVNFLALLGWNPGTEKEIFNKKEELIKEFSLRRIQKGGAIFNIDRLDWLNKQYIKKTPSEKLEKDLLDYLPENFKNSAKKNKKMWGKIVDLEKERISKLSDIKEGIGYFFTEPVFSPSLLIWKDSDKDKTRIHLEQLVKILCDIQEKEFTKDNVKNAIWDYAEKQGRGNTLWPFRVALTGLERSPEPFIIADILGKDQTIKRLKNAVEIIKT